VDSAHFFRYPGETPEAADAFLAGLHEDEVARLLQYLEVRRLRAGDAAIRQGERSRDVFIVAAGRFAVIVSTGGNSFEADSYGPGEVFGEVGFFDSQPRAATVRALEESEVLVLTPLGFRRLRLGEPRLAMLLALDLGQILAQRFRDHDRQLMSLRKGRDQRRRRHV